MTRRRGARGPSVVIVVVMAVLGVAACSSDGENTVKGPVAGPVPPAVAESGGATSVFDVTTAAFTRRCKPTVAAAPT